MDAKEFASTYGEAFGPAAGLPLLFWYSDGPVRAVPKVEGCFFKALAEAREGSAVSLNAANIGCGGGKFYTGFAPMPPFVPAFVSQKEHYKQTPEMVLEFIGRLGVRRRDAGRAGEPPGRTQRLPGVVRSFGASVGRRLGAGVRRADVAFARDVRHDACKLSFRDPCVEQGPGPH